MQFLFNVMIFELNEPANLREQDFEYLTCKYICELLFVILKTGVTLLNVEVKQFFSK